MEKSLTVCFHGFLSLRWKKRPHSTPIGSKVINSQLTCSYDVVTQASICNISGVVLVSTEPGVSFSGYYSEHCRSERRSFMHCPITKLKGLTFSTPFSPEAEFFLVFTEAQLFLPQYVFYRLALGSQGNEK